ncbi:MAG: restriction endonuclease subunit S [Pontiellaceae bacterium]|nr:restriction endonuclease subunit S [Pontiellaceae bacterium]
MKKTTEHPLLPKLRFPEFQNDGEWEKQPLSEFLRSHSARVSQSTELPVYSSTREGLQLQAEYYGGENRTNKGDYGVVPQGHFVYRHMSDDGIFKFNINTTGGDIAVSKEYPVFTTKNLNAEFLLHLLDWSPEFKDFCLAQKKGGTRTRLYLSALGKWSPALPQVLEQQKIAECLGSLDELITAHGARLAALQDHKKGLLQQLFPAEGQTTPTLRFPEFQNAGEWEEISIQELIDRKMIIGHLDGNHGALYPRAEEFSKEGVPYITANDFKDGCVDFEQCKFLPEERALKFRKGVAKDGDILFAHNATVGPVAKLRTELEFVILSTTATFFRCDQIHLINDFLMHALCSTEFVDQYTRVMSQSTRNQVPITAQRKFHLQIPPPPEQQRIADCLSSLDGMIAAQAEQIAALKELKKGLMQQLFPNPELGGQ